MSVLRMSRRAALGAIALTGIAGVLAMRCFPTADRRPLLLIDETLRNDAWASVTAPAAAATIRLERELVRQWRGGLGALVLTHPPAFAIVRWDKALLLEGLAREAGLRTRRSRLSRAVSRIAIG